MRVLDIRLLSLRRDGGVLGRCGDVLSSKGVCLFISIDFSFLLTPTLTSAFKWPVAGVTCNR